MGFYVPHISSSLATISSSDNTVSPRDFSCLFFSFLVISRLGVSGVRGVKGIYGLYGVGIPVRGAAPRVPGAGRSRMVVLVGGALRGMLS